MGPFSTLSPVDPSRRHPLLPQGPNGQQMAISAQDLKYAVEFIKREAGDEGLSGEAFGQVITALFDKIHPLAIGAIEQSYSLSRLITERMLTTHMNPETEKDAIQRIVDLMSDSYGSHSFPIGLREAEHLGLKVKRAPRDLHDALWALLNYYQSHTPSPADATVSTPQGSQPALVVLEARLDSVDLRIDAQGFSAKSGDRQERKGGRWVSLPEA